MSDSKPPSGLPVKIKTVRGIRKAVWDDDYWRYRYTDCTHPMQQAICHPDDVIEWWPEGVATLRVVK